MIKVVDNFLEEEEYKNLYDTVMGSYFPWYTGKILDEFPFTNEKHNLQMSHSLYMNSVPQSNHFELLNYFVPKLKIAAWFTSKFNLNFCYSKTVEHGYHCDNNNIHCMTAVYYVNTNDGYTKFETGEKIESVANRIVIFPTTTMHTGTTCTDTDRRVVLNMNYFPATTD